MRAACATGIPASAWIDWWSGDLDPEEASRLEEHVFTCDACAAEADAARGLLDAIRDAVRRKPPAGATTRALIDALDRDRRAVRRFVLPWNGSVHCTVGAEDDLVVLELQGDFRGVERADMIVTREGRLVRRSEDLPIVGGATVFWAETGEEIRRFPRATFEVVLLAVEAAGEREIARYTLDHTPPAG